MKDSKSTYYILVIVDKQLDEIVATGSLILERKFLRSAGTCGHIEDIAVSKKVQGKRLGYYIVTALTDLGEKVGCYKVILDCSEENRGELACQSVFASCSALMSLEQASMRSAGTSTRVYKWRSTRCSTGLAKANAVLLLNLVRVRNIGPCDALHQIRSAEQICASFRWRRFVQPPRPACHYLTTT